MRSSPNLKLIYDASAVPGAGHNVFECKIQQQGEHPQGFNEIVEARLKLEIEIMRRRQSETFGRDFD